jgi:hypothetical protein
VRNKPTPENVAEFASFVAEYQTLLNLRDWRIEHSGKFASKGAMADVVISLEDRLAVWSMGRDWGNCPVTEKTLRKTALHEVLHIFLRSLMDACSSRDESAIETLEHSVIVVLEKLLTR